MSPKIEESISEKLKKVKIKDIMTRSVIATTEEENLSDVADLFIKSKISGVPVLDKEKRMVGIITTTDFLNLMEKIKSGSLSKMGNSIKTDLKVKEVMTRKVIIMTEGESLWDAIDVMSTKDIHTIPVIREDKLVGVLGRRDIIMYFYAALRDSIEEMKQ